MGGISYERGNSLAIDTSGSIYVAGTYYGTADFDPNETNYYLTANGSGEIFVVKLENETMGTIPIETSDYMLYPNPGDGIFHLTSFENLSKIIVYDRMGRRIIEQNIQGKQIDLTDLPVGIYFVTIINSDNLEHSEKIIIN